MTSSAGQSPGQSIGQSTGQWVASLEDLAREALPEAVHRYFRQGSRDGLAAAEATAAWDTFRVLPRILRDVTEVDIAASALGTPVQTPIAVAPTTLQQAARPEGEVAMARAVADSGSLLVVSSNAGSSFTAIAATGVRWWLQAYLTADRSAILPLLERASEAGASAVVLTADTPVVATKYDVGPSVWETVDPSWLRGNHHDGRASVPGSEKATDLGPDDIGWLAAVTGLPVVVKGVLRADDARMCVDAGAAAVWVSNHGGRQLDRTTSTAHVLESIRAAVSAAAQVYVDGGVRHARHGFTALALGADLVFLGRLPLYALAVDGDLGVRRLLAEMDADLVETMRLAGCHDLASVTRDLLAEPAEPREPH